MCLFPRTINRSNRLGGFNKKDGDVFLPYHHYGDFFEKRLRLSMLYGFNRSVMNVPCGKCTECLKRRQNDIAVRAMREASKRGSMCFVTLTYDNEYLPLSIKLLRIDKDSGEEFSDYPASLLVRYKGEIDDLEHQQFISYCRSGIESIALSPHARVVTVPFFETDTQLYRYEITPSLNRRDVRLWLKRSRVRYERERGEKLPDFSYIVCGEYGPKTCRPHYHICFFGLQLSHVSYLVNQWDYGFTNVKQVNAVNPDGTNGYEIAAKYVGKYLSKGKFECDSVKCGLSEKPRLMLSRGVGSDLSDDLVSYYRCYDLFGKYDIENPRLSDSQLQVLFSEISKRSKVVIGPVSYSLPRALTLKIWYNYHESTKSYRASKLRLLYAASLQDKSFDLFVRKFKEDNSCVQEGDFAAACSEFIAQSENANLLQDMFNEGALRSFYLNSIF